MANWRMIDAGTLLPVPPRSIIEPLPPKPTV